MLETSRPAAPRARAHFVMGALVSLTVALACSRNFAPHPEPEPRTNASPPKRPAAPNGHDPEPFVDVAQRALPAVVSVASTRVGKVEAPDAPGLFDDPFFRHFFGPRGPVPFAPPNGEAPLEHGLGSGVIVGKDVILTNSHVVENARDIVVTAGEKRVLSAKVVGSDPKSDLAVLRITGDTSGLTALQFAEPSELRLGQMVLAIGYPFGLGSTVTMGIISAKGRSNLGIEDYEDFIQTDAAINPGNSGGALVDLDGNLVGIPTAILSRSGGNMGVGFAIPASMAKPIMTSLLEHGRVTRGYLGVTIQAVDADLARALKLPSDDGVLISEVVAGGPAAKAGLKRGDVVLAVDGTRVSTTGAFRNLIAAATPTKTITLEIFRSGKRDKIAVVAGSMPDDLNRPAASTAPDGGAANLDGLTVAPLDDTARKRLSVPASVGSGLVVNAIEPGSPAAVADLRPGDVLLELDKQPITTEKDLSDRLGKQKGPVALLVWRDGRTFYAVLKP